jgi:hypothetical protein
MTRKRLWNRRLSDLKRAATAMGLWLLGVCFGAAMFQAGFETVMETRRIRAGASAPAEVVRVRIENEGSRRRGPVYVPEVQFAFTYGGQTFLGTRLRPEGAAFRREAKAGDYLTAAIQQPLTAYFDPAAPERAVLSPAIGLRTAGFLLIGSAAICGTTLFMVAWSPRRRFVEKGLPIDTRRRKDGYVVRASGRSAPAWAVQLSLGAALLLAVLWTSHFVAFGDLALVPLSDAVMAASGGGPVVACAALLVYLRWRRRPLGHGIAIDVRRREVKVLSWRGLRGDPLEVIPFERIARIELETVEPGDTETLAQYSPNLVLHDYARGCVVLRQMRWERADALEWAEWIHELVKGRPRDFE